jgi:hypothetical protein
MPFCVPPHNPAISLIPPQDRLRLASLLERTLTDLAPQYVKPRYANVPDILRGEGLSSGHFDPVFWQIDEWLSPAKEKIVVRPENLKMRALVHFQRDRFRPSVRHAATWLAMNILLQHKSMKRGEWPYLESRSLDQVANPLSSKRMLDIQEYWRCDGLQGGLWCYPRESFREESPRGQWLVIARYPEAFAYGITTLGVPSVVILPGPLPEHRIVLQAPGEVLLGAIQSTHGDVESFLTALES